MDHGGLRPGLIMARVFQCFHKSARLGLRLIAVITQPLVPLPQVSLLVVMGGELLSARRLF
jgi:hypothetical protein